MEFLRAMVFLLTMKITHCIEPLLFEYFLTYYVCIHLSCYPIYAFFKTTYLLHFFTGAAGTLTQKQPIPEAKL